jgi:hypothetical protein
MKKERLSQIVKHYLNRRIDKNEWKWISLGIDKPPYYLFIDNRRTIITVYPPLMMKMYHDVGLNFIKMDQFDCVLAKNLSEKIFKMFGDENLNSCEEILVEWVSENIPLYPDKIDAIGQKRKVEKN